MNNTEHDAFSVAKANAMLTVWAEKWAKKWADYTVLEVEHEFKFPLLNPETEAASRSFLEAGKIDVLIQHKATKKIVVVEHKTTSEAIDPGSDYWDRLRMDTQCSKYYLAASHMNVGDVGSILYDVLRKPLQRPSTIPDLDPDGYKIVKDAVGTRIYTTNGKKPRETGDPDRGWVVQGRPETPDEYRDRLLAVLRSAPDDYLAQREIPRLNSDLIEYMSDAWSNSQQILYFRNRGLWARNPQACKIMGTCDFFDLCCGRASVDGVRYAHRDQANPELTIQGGDLDLLTASRTNAFNKCRRYHKLKYEDLIDRVTEDDNGARAFGSLVHSALQAFFESLKSAQTPISRSETTIPIAAGSPAVV